MNLFKKFALLIYNEKAFILEIIYIYIYGACEGQSSAPKWLDEFGRLSQEAIPQKQGLFFLAAPALSDRSCHVLKNAMLIQW